MSFFKLQIKDMSRYIIQYPTSNPGPKLFEVFSAKPLEASVQTVDILGTDQVTFSFERSFTSVPVAIAGFVSLNSSVAGVNVYVESVTRTGGTVRTSAPVDSAKIAIHAVYVE